MVGGIHKQKIRAYRIGQNKKVTILKLINEEELSNLLTDGYKKDKEV